MKYLLCENPAVEGKNVVLSDMILTKDFPTTAGSRMLEGYMSLFDAEVVDRLKAAGYAIRGKANVGELTLGVLGENSYFGACAENGVLVDASVIALRETDAAAVIGLDAGGTPRRGAALGGMVAVKPTYGTVSRFGTISMACSGEAVSVTGRSVSEVRDMLNVLVGHDDKDGTSLPEEKCALVKAGDASVRRVAIARELTASVNAEMQAKVAAARVALEKSGIEVVEIDDSLLLAAKTAWNILMSAELCNNVSRYDGVKYGYRTKNYKTIDELYTGSRTEAFGELLKYAILFGSETLSTENYMKMYDKSLRVRRLLVERLAEIFSEFDALLLPVASKCAFMEEEARENIHLSYDEARYTAPASITGVPAIALRGVQLMGAAFSENKLYSLAEILEGGAE